MRPEDDSEVGVVLVDYITGFLPGFCTFEGFGEHEETIINPISHGKQSRVACFHEVASELHADSPDVGSRNESHGDACVDEVVRFDPHAGPCSLRRKDSDLSVGVCCVVAASAGTYWSA